LKTYTILRDGQKNLRFTGEMLADVDNKWVADMVNNRWHELSLFKTKGGKYVLQEVYCTIYQGELEAYSAKVLNTAKEVLEALTDGEGVLTDLDKKLMQQAAKNDSAFTDLWVEVLDDDRPPEVY